MPMIKVFNTAIQYIIVVHTTASFPLPSSFIIGILNYA